MGIVKKFVDIVFIVSQRKEGFQFYMYIGVYIVDIDSFGSIIL